MKSISIKLLLAFLFFSNVAFSQDYKAYIDPKWDKYYNDNPSEIITNFRAVDFIRIIDIVGFKPTRKELKNDVDLFKKGLLRFEFQDLNQMRITGSFYSRTYKHDDYFILYNLYYPKISKSVWDTYCPYLIPLMELDDTITLSQN